MFDEWDALVQRFSREANFFGKPIDPEIFETVIVLNALGIPTVRSCGGCIDEERGLLLPWVDIEVSDARLKGMVRTETQLARQAKALHQEAKRLHGRGTRGTVGYDTQMQANKMYERLHELQREIRVLQAGVRIKIADYLVRFYADRQVPCDQRLVLSGLGSMRLHNQGAFECYLLEPESVLRQKLQTYREEMAAFTLFLKQVYFARQVSLVPHP